MSPRDFHVMVDLETLSNRPTATIHEIGAVPFEKKAQGEIFMSQGFHQHVSVHGQFRDIEASTLLWFMSRGEFALQRFLEGQRRAAPLEEAQRALTMWFADNCRMSRQEYQLAGVWAKPSEYDLPILSDLYGGTERRPWSRKLSRDMKTFLQEHPSLVEERWGYEHDAFHDACTQARHMIRVLTAEARLPLLVRGEPWVSQEQEHAAKMGNPRHEAGRQAAAALRPRFGSGSLIAALKPNNGSGESQ